MVLHGCCSFRVELTERIEPQVVSDFRNPWEEWEIWKILTRKAVLGDMGNMEGVEKRGRNPGVFRSGFS